jgi:hypothetical protein
MITVKKLIEQLSKLDPDSRVLVQSDAEGNGYAECAGADPAFVLEFSRELQVYNNDWSADECDMDQEEYDSMRNDKSKRCVVIFPA